MKPNDAKTQILGQALNEAFYLADLGIHAGQLLYDFRFVKTAAPISSPLQFPINSCPLAESIKRPRLETEPE